MNGADAIWFGGGAQSFYQSVWEGTSLFGALARAAASNVAIGGTSAGMAILGRAAYVDLPWDSVKSRFATQNPLDPRVNIAYQGSQLPFGALSAGSAYLVTPSSNSVKPRLQDNCRLTFGPMNVYRLGPGSSRNLSDVLIGSPSYRIRVAHGTRCLVHYP